MRLTLAFLAAILVPTSLMGAWYLYGQFASFSPGDPYIWVRTRGFLALCLAISTVYVIVLGIPVYAILRWRNAVRWWSTIASGFVLGATPAALWSWPLRFPEMKTSASVDGIQTMVNGTPTAAGWLQYLELVSFLGICGAVGATAFWLVLRK